MATWPASLPQRPLRDSWQEVEGWGVIESPPDIGPVLTRPRFTATEKPRSAEFNLDSAQKAAMETFFRSDLAGGALPFDASWDGTSRSYRLVAAPTYRMRGIKWRVRLDAVVLP